jgi:hypothetical protein
LLKINEEYPDWSEGKNVRVIGICTDLNGNMTGVKPLVYAHDISFEIYIDKNNDFKRAMNIPDLPYLIMIDGKTEVARSMGYCPDIAGFVNGGMDLQLAEVPGGK